MSEEQPQKALIDAHSIEGLGATGPYGPGEEWSSWELPILAGTLARDHWRALVVPVSLVLLGQLAVQSSLWLLPAAWILGGVGGLLMIQLALQGAVTPEVISVRECWIRVRERIGTLLLSQMIVGAAYGVLIFGLAVAAGLLSAVSKVYLVPFTIPVVAVIAAAIMTFTSVSVLSADDGPLEGVVRSLQVFRARFLGNLMIFIALAMATNGLILLLAGAEGAVPKLLISVVTTGVALVGAWLDASITSLRYHQIRSTQNAALGLPPPRHSTPAPDSQHSLLEVPSSPSPMP